MSHHTAKTVAVTLAAAVGTLGVATSGAAAATVTKAQIAHAPADAPTIVLVHGAFADSSSWSSEVTTLRGAGYRVVAFADPLRRLASDARSLRGLLASIDGPKVLVGHSYAGMVISQAAAEDRDVKALVYVAAFIPKVGESVNSLNSRYPGSQLVPDNLQFAKSAGGLTDVTIKPDVYGRVYAGGLGARALTIAAATQRPITAEALADKATVAAPRATPKWEIVATRDHAVPPKVQRFMAKRAGAHVATAASGHDVPAARPDVVTKVIVQAAAAAR